jgi:hypothetical protein
MPRRSVVRLRPWSPPSVAASARTRAGKATAPARWSGASGWCVFNPSHAPASRVAGGVSMSVVAGGVEDHRQQAKRLVDLVWPEGAFAELGGFVAVDILRPDLVEVHRREVREQMPAQLPAVALHGFRPKLWLPVLQPFGSELMESRCLGHLRSQRRFVRSPDTSLDIGQDVSQLCLGPLTVPAFLCGAERYVAPLAVCPKPDRPAATVGWLDHLSRRLARHTYLSRRRPLVRPLLADRKQPHSAPSAGQRLIRPLTRGGGRVSRRFLANPPQNPSGDLWIEPKPRLRPATELDRPKLDCMGVDPRPLDPEPLANSAASTNSRSCKPTPFFKQLDHLPGDCLGCLRIELDARGCHLAPVVHLEARMHRMDPRKTRFPMMCRAVGLVLGEGGEIQRWWPSGVPGGVVGSEAHFWPVR